MTSEAKATFSRLLWLVLALFSLSIGKLLGDAALRGDKIVPRNLYELRFLGCELNKTTDDKRHIGIFVLIWKGREPISIKSIPSADKKTFHPLPDFRAHEFLGLQAHEGSGWFGIGKIEDPPEWMSIQPGQVITFSTGMGWIDNNYGGFAIDKADKACLILDSKNGELFSDEFSLPLTPLIKK